MFNYFLIFWTSTLPFFVLNGYYEKPKFAVFLAGTFITFLYWVKNKIPLSLNISKADYLYIGWFLILVVSSLVFGDVDRSVTGEGNRYLGILFFMGLWVVGKSVQIMPEKYKMLMGGVFGFAALIQSIILLAQIVAGQVYFLRPLGTVGDANQAAGLIILGLYFVTEYLPGVFAVFPALAILLTWSKSGIISILVFSGAFFGKMNKKISAIFIFGLLTLFVIFSVSTSQTSSKFEDRKVIWPKSLEIVLQSPVVGHGLGITDKLFSESFKTTGTPIESLRIDSAHNIFLDVAIWSGGVGVFVFLYYIYSIFKTLENRKRIAALAFLAFATFQPLSVSHWLWFTILIFV